MTKTYQLDPENARTHPDENKALVNTSLKTLGGGRSILVDGDGIVRAGNKTYEEAVALGMEIVEVETKPNQLVAVKRPDLKGADAVRMGLIDNQATDASHFDGEILLKLAEKYGEDVVQEGVFSEAEWQELVKHVEEPQGGDAEPQIDRAAELQAQWQVQPGELFELGNHRLICGDCTDAATVDRLMGGEKANLLMTSPPYWVGKDYETQKNEKEIDSFISSFVSSSIIAISEDYSRIVINTGTGRATAIGEKESRIILLLDKYVNNYAVLGWKLRHIRHWIKGGGRDRPGRPIDDQVYFGIEYLLVFYKSKSKTRGQNRLDYAWVQQSDWTDIKGDKQENEAGYPKELPSRFIELYTLPNEFCYDPFMGNGTTLISCQNLNRRCAGVEISPAYCAVILQRFTDAFPGLEIRRYPV